MTSPISGNQNFTGIRSGSNVFSTITANQIRGDNLEVGLITGTNNYPGLGKLKQVIGYAPIGFNTTGVGSGVFLNRGAGLNAATDSTNVQLLTLPQDCTVVQVNLTNNGTPITNATGTYDICLQAWSATPLTAAAANAAIPNSAITNAMNAEAINGRGGGLIIGSGTQAVIGVATGAVASQVGAKGDASNPTYIGCLVQTNANTTGDMAVRITYLDPN